MKLKWPNLKSFVWLCGLACLALAMPAAAQTTNIIFHLKNGDRITGAVSSEDTNKVVVSTPWAGTVQIPLVQIQRREVSPGAVTPAVAPAKPANLPAVVVKPPAPAPEKPKGPKRWSGDIMLGMDLGFSERNRQLYSGRAKVSYVYENFRNIIEYDFSYGRTDGVLSANRMDGFIKSDYDLGPRWYVYNILGAGYDEIRKIRHRYEIGPGVGYHLVKRPTFLLNLESGVNYQSQLFTDKTDLELFYFRLAENFSWKLAEKLTLDEKFEFMPRVEDPSEYKIRFESNLRYYFYSNFSLNLTVLDLFETQTARGVSQNDLQIRSSIGFKF